MLVAELDIPGNRRSFHKTRTLDAIFVNGFFDNPAFVRHAYLHIFR
jgi:hypothetical protein